MHTVVRCIVRLIRLQPPEYVTRELYGAALRLASAVAGTVNPYESKAPQPSPAARARGSSSAAGLAASWDVVDAREGAEADATAPPSGGAAPEVSWGRLRVLDPQSPPRGADVSKEVHLRLVFDFDLWSAAEPEVRMKWGVCVCTAT